MTTLYIIRHGETEENRNGVFQGQTPGHLSETGRQQAMNLRKTVASLTFDAVLCSDLQRCLDTASIILDGMNVGITTTALLRERDMGNLVGTSVKGAHLNPSVESIGSIRERSREFLSLLRKHYDNKSVLVISHGFFIRVLLAEIAGIPPMDIPKMNNCEIRIANY